MIIDEGMREYKSPSEVRLERLVHGLSVFTFVLSCWTLNRVLTPRTNCVSSDFVGAVLIEGRRIDNCAFESRLKIGGPELTRVGHERLRTLENTAALADWFTPARHLLVEVTERDPHAFRVFPNGALRLGSAWVDEKTQVPRALAMALLRTRPAFREISHFQLEVLADFVVLAGSRHAAFTDQLGRAHDWARDVRLSTAASTVAGYCKSPHRSLAHERVCRARLMPEEQGGVWNARPLVASALAREFRKLGLAQKMRVLGAIREGVPLPEVGTPKDRSVKALVEWLEKTTRDFAGALQMLTSPAADVALVDTIRELDLETPLRWDVTFDLRSAPQWREILRQLEGRARFRPRERALVFTPDGEIALPSGLPVEWLVEDLRTAKHVLIACRMPTAREAVPLTAPRFFVRQTCGPLDNSFWD